ncbi:MAG: hypothetical protein QOJ65_1851 [Fimbriimonadaceae bacterium]|jgi:hypothetical protein|nr:hypothetical protein [Fimbriimonadaceae bacterium]
MSAAFWATTASCGLAIAAGWNATALRDQVNPPHPVAGLEFHETHASASLLGQFRTSTSSWLWLRTDLYLHNGVELRPLTKGERDAGHKGVGSAEKDLGAAMNDDSVVTSIPSVDRDFRGWLGNLERATSTYRDMHNHTHNNPEQALPLFRLMTWIDPNFIEGWTVGATVIARDRTDIGFEKALAYLNEGLAANPQNVQILNDIGFMYATRKKDLKTAVGYLERAREAGSKDTSHLSDEERDELAQVYRWLALCYRDLGEREKMSATIRAGLEKFSDDPVLKLLSDPPPVFLTEKGRAKWEAARNRRAHEETEHASEEAHSHEEDHH